MMELWHENALCITDNSEVNPLITNSFSSQTPNDTERRSNKQSIGWLFETPWRPRDSSVMSDIISRHTDKISFTNHCMTSWIAKWGNTQMNLWIWNRDQTGLVSFSAVWNYLLTIRNLTRANPSHGGIMAAMANVTTHCTSCQSLGEFIFSNIL